jgi:hypothetical protein
MAVIRTAADVPERPDGRVHFLLHFEGGRPLEGGIGALRMFFRLGLRSLQVTWNVRNELGDGVHERRTSGGLTVFGVEAVREAHRLGIAIVRRSEGDVFEFGGTQVSVLAPPSDWQTSAQPRNDDSLVLHFSYGDSSCLLEGDAEKTVEQNVTSRYHPRADLRKVAHNGSLTSTTPVGARNTFGHPRIEILKRLQGAGTATYRTDLNGAVTFYLDGRSVSPHLACLR